ncbi:MAG: hypothetical protein GXY52_10085 [Chloroflexi bacterium]|nr:hypothetical protein [Chloroflexota bacterium]
MTSIHITVPTRVDFAGSTLDVYPLYLFEGGGLTVNAAIDVHAEAILETRPDTQFTIHSRDLQLTEELPSLEAMTFGGRLDLVKRALAYFKPEMGLDITIASAAPNGSGLGASSALLMALAHGLNQLTGRGFTSERIIDLGANIEAQVIGIPTGKQDYFPPIYGGVCAMWFDVDGWTIEQLHADSDLIAELNRRLIISYTGVPHDSAITNWAMLKSYIERQGSTVANMHAIRSIADDMRACLLVGDFALFGELVEAEWQLRRGLAEGVTNAEIERAMAAARGAGAVASKICGAGGGGCMITVTEPAQREAVQRALNANGARVMDAKVVTQGITIR